MTLSVRVRESIKTGLAMAVTIAIAFRMDFLEPQWAGFAVAFISLDTAGQSLNKAALRMLGTLLAFVVSLTLAALFPQERWAMMLALSPYIGLCAYMTGGTKRPYLWFVSAFVVITIMLHGGMDSLGMFQQAVARVEETALGIGVYALISIFLWPRDSREALEAAARALFDVQLALLRAYRGLLAGRGSLEDSRPLRLQAEQSLRGLGQALNAAETDTYRVWELRFAWRQVLRQTQSLLRTLARWRTTIPEARELPLARLAPGLEAKLDEIERRLALMEPVLAGSDPEPPPPAAEPEPAPGELQALSHFQRAALLQLLTQVRGLDAASRSLLESLRDIRGEDRIAARAVPGGAPRAGFSVDPDRLRAAVNIVATMWIGFAVWVWVDPPGHAFFWFNATLYGLLSVLARQPVLSLLPGFLLGIVVGGVAYVGVMPHLSGYGELGLLLFLATAAGSYWLWGPRRGGMKSAYLAMFLTAISVDNQQTYSFAAYANTSASALLAFALAAGVGYFPSSPRPEKAFLRQLARFFRHAELLISRLAPDPAPRGLGERLRGVAYRNDLMELPVKLAALADRIDYQLLPGTRPEQVRALVMHLGSLTWRIEELLEARRHVEPDPRLEEIVTELRDWRLVAQRQLRLWATDPAASLDPDSDIGDRLRTRLARIEAGLEAARGRLDAAGQGLDYEALYRYLGGFRGLSETAVAYSGVAAGVAWEPWKEARF